MGRNNFQRYVLMVFFCVGGIFLDVVQGQYSGGRGTIDDPCQIGTVDDWKLLMNRPKDWDNHFVLIADINFSQAYLTPVGSKDEPFSGVFDGKGFTLKQAVIYFPDDDYIGLFGYSSAESIIRNIVVENVIVVGHERVGGLVGYNKADILDCTISGRVMVFGRKLVD